MGTPMYAESVKGMATTIRFPSFSCDSETSRYPIVWSEITNIDTAPPRTNQFLYASLAADEILQTDARQ